MGIKNIPLSIYAQYLLYKCLPFCLKEHKCLLFRYVGRICPLYNKIIKGKPGSLTSVVSFNNSGASELH